MLAKTDLDIYNAIEEKRRLVIFSLAIACAVLLSFSANYSWLNYDSFWLLKTAQDWFELGLSPWVDHYSFTQPGESVHSPRIVFGTIYYGFVKLFGEQYGAFALRLCSFLLVYLCFLIWSKQVRAPAVAYLVTLPMLVVAIQQRPLIRPEMLSYSLIVVAFMLYQRARQNFGWQTVLPIAVFMAIWTNYHSSIFGWVIFFGFFADIGYRLLTNRDSIRNWVIWFSLGMVVLLSGYLNPGMSHPIWGMLNFSAEWKSLIKEYDPPSRYFLQPTFYVFVFAALTTLFLSIRQRKIGYLVALVVFLKSSSTTSRMITPTVIVCAAMLIHLLADAKLGIVLGNWRKPAKSIGVAMAMLAFSIPMYRAIQLAHAYSTLDIQARTLYPTSLILHIRNQNISGRLFNEYHLGGYLLYNLSPDIKIHIDGRTAILYPLEFTKEYFNSKNDPSGLFELVERYDINLAVLTNRQANAKNLYYLGFKLEFSDIDYSLYKKNSGNLALLGQAWAMPYCWDETMGNGVLQEIQNGSLELIGDRNIRKLAQTISEYLASNPEDQYLDRIKIDSNFGDASIRFLAYRAVEKNQFSTALRLLSHIQTWEVKDVQLVSYAYYSIQEFNSALLEIDRLLKNAPAQIERSDLEFQRKLLTQLSKRVSLNGFQNQYLQQLSKSLGSQVSDNSDISHSISEFCQLRSGTRED